METEFERQYVRIAFHNNFNGESYILMQELDNGMLMLPGGQTENTDADLFETISRELLEETMITQELLLALISKLKTTTLVNSYWDKYLDTIFILPWMSEYEPISQQNRNDSEIIKMEWIPLKDIYNEQVKSKTYKNIQDALLLVVQKL